MTRTRAWAAPLALLLVIRPDAAAQSPLPPPESVLGFEPCSDRRLATSEVIDSYFQALARASDRVRLVEIGRSADGRPLRLAVISSEANLAKLDEHRRTARTLALARHDDGRPLADAEARALADTGRAIVWVDFGLHSTEVAHAQSAPLFAWRVAGGETAELRRIREDAILLLMPDMNPDGTTLVADWYMRHVGTPYERSAPPELYHRYAGHDNNRDWFMFAMPESQAVARQLYEVWFPQILHNQHQEAPFPARIFVPPFKEPMNPRIPPLVMRGIATVGSAIARRLEQEGRTGVVSGVQFDTWWNGGMRTAPYFHNMVGILTETAHASATPSVYDAASFPDTFAGGVPSREPSTRYPSPYRGGAWHLRDSCEYMLSASMAVLDVGARRRGEWLYDIYQMGRDAIRAGGTRAWIVPAAQRDAGAAVAMIDALRRGGVEVERAAEALSAGGREYGAGSFVIREAQPFRAYVQDLLEPQEYPDRRLYPGGPPERPYDITGWTLPLQMGVRVDRVEGVGAARTTRVDRPGPPEVEVPAAARAAWALDSRTNAAYRLANRLLAAGAEVSRLAVPLTAGGVEWPAGTFLVAPGPAIDPRLREGAAELGVPVRALDAWPDGPRPRLRPRRIGLYRPWGGSADEGWTRFVLERHEFSFTTVRDADVRRGGLRASYDVLVLPDVAYDALLSGRDAGVVPPEYAGGLTPRGVAALYEFVAAGGSLVTLDSSSELPLVAFGLPLRNVLANADPAAFYIPGSLLRLEVDPAVPLAWGVAPDAAAFFAHGLAFTTRGRHDDRVAGAARYADAPLLSGWQLGAERLAGHLAVAEVPVERGRVILLGFRVQHRAQPHGTFKFLFNALLPPETPEEREPAGR